MNRAQVLQLAVYAKKYGVIASLPNLTQLVPSTIDGGKILQATVGNQFITLRKDGKLVTKLPRREVLRSSSPTCRAPRASH